MLYKNLTVWKRSMELVKRIYALCRTFPQSEQYGLRSQMTRSAVSIPSNIAEGSGRATSTDRVRFLSISRGSLYELSTQVDIAVMLGYCSTDEELAKLIDEIAKMLTKMLSK